ncbi:MAG: aminotransferase class I/II-fold pyridoxal phosphate-dependent enzyme [Pseudomonadota bacterium]
MRDFALETYFSRWEFNARYHMTASDIESVSIADLLSMATDEDRDAFNNCWLGYTETWGAPDLREQISYTYENVAPDDILCFAGAEEGVYAAMRVLLQAGDHVICAVPNYQAAETVPLEICNVSGVPLDPDDNWQLDIDAVAAAIRPNTKLISVNFPNNPTGAVLERDRFDALVGLCRENGIYLFSDEVYRGVERADDVRLPQAADVYERGLSLNVMSKAFGMPGLRIGWIACRDRGVLQKLERYKHYLSICNSAPSERLSIIALKNRENILARNRTLVNENANLLTDFFSRYPNTFEWVRPDGGCVGYPRFVAGDTNRFCETLVEETGVLLLPPKIYHSDLLEVPADRFRVGFGRKKQIEGLQVWDEYLWAKDFH